MRLWLTVNENGTRFVWTVKPSYHNGHWGGLGGQVMPIEDGVLPWPRGFGEDAIVEVEVTTVKGGV